LISLPQDIFEAIEQGVSVVVPSRQRAQAVRLAYAAATLASNRRVWATPDVLPLDAWLARELDRRAAAGHAVPRILSAAEEWLLWRQAAAQLTHDLDLISRGPLSDALRHASRTALEYRLDPVSFRGAPGTETRLLYEAERAVRERAQSLGAETAAHLSDACAGSERPVLIAGITKASPHLSRLIERRNEAGCRTRARTPAPHADGTTRAVIARDASDELERIAEWCRARVEKQPDARLFILLSGSAEARERLVALIRQSIDPAGAATGDLLEPGRSDIATIEGGAPLSRAPLAAHALDSLAWLAGAAEFADVSGWLSAPYWLVPEAQRARMDLWLRERAGLELDPRGLLSLLATVPESLVPAAKELAGHVQAALQKLGTGNASPRQWSERFRDALVALGWPGIRVLNSDAEQTRARFTELLDDFGQLAAAVPSISRQDAIAWLRELASRTSFRPASGDPLVTVSPMLTDPIVRYDGIWVAGLHADAWPQPVQPDPFLPLVAQIGAGVPAASAVARAEEARLLLNAWQASTDELILSAPARSDDVELSLSPMLKPFLDTSVEDAEPSEWLALQLHREGQTHAYEDAVGIPWDPARPLPLGTRSIDLQNRCPFRAYAELRLGGDDLAIPEPGVPADVRGMLLHAALEVLWRTLGNSRALLDTSPERLTALIADSVEQAAHIAFGGAHERRTPAQSRELARTARLIRALCDVEKQRAHFTVKATELDQTVRLGAAQLRLRIDRVDQLEAGGLAILDYKSGKRVPGGWDRDRPTHPQLLAYLAAIGEDARAVATVNVTATEVRFDGVAASAGLLPKVRAVSAPGADGDTDAWTLRRREWLACVEKLATDFLGGRAVVDPMPNACDFCPVIGVCRIADRAAAEIATDPYD
jgi:ATP-dependent helicase/nuclease subunit B